KVRRYGARPNATAEIVRNSRGSIQEGAGADKPCCNCSGREAQQGPGPADIRDSETMNETAGSAACKLSTAAASEAQTTLETPATPETQATPEAPATPDTDAAPARDARLRPLKLLVPFVMGHRGRVAAALVAL